MSSFILLDSDALMNAAEGLEREQASVLDELVVKSGQEEVVGQHLIALSQLDLSTVKVKVNVQTLDELGDRILVVVRLLLYDLHQVFHDVLATFADYGRRCDVAKYVRTCRLYHIQITFNFFFVFFNNIEH